MLRRGPGRREAACSGKYYQCLSRSHPSPVPSDLKGGSTEKSSTIIVPLPIDVLTAFFQKKEKE